MRTMVAISLGLFVFSAALLHAGDRSPSPFHQSPRKRPGPVLPEVQTDDYSCGFHWIVLSGHDEGRITIADSLKPAPLQVWLDDLVDGPLLSAVILQPTSPSRGPPFT